ncbi:MAG: 2-oxoglutarate dehydrogenase, E2 component, dihydrolipoamide succinyltransferase, partial [Candidatus Eremiobacteraeota bacterium]|nr:2-oxoglutarate dehydrogenase, E2 component, dihydrolipoamide succinyltransferase [Candidatus Eremiobacteraeota bacterium]
AVVAAPAAVAAAPQVQAPRAPGIVTPRRVAPAAPVVPVAAPVAAEALLGAFSSAPAFLAAFVLSEALAPPVSLREPRVT